MKLVVAGSTGLLGSEIIRQTLHIPEITEVVALSRKPLRLDEGLDSSKIKTVIISDYGEYPDEVKAEFAGADACIWCACHTSPHVEFYTYQLDRGYRTVAITPFRSGEFDSAEVKRVCQDCTKIGFDAMNNAGPARPFRFIYLSADGTPRDPEKKAFLWAEYQVMRCNTELMVLKFPTENEGVEICIAQPGVITNWTSFTRGVVASVFSATNLIGVLFPNIYLVDAAAAVLDQAVHGIEKETLRNADLVRIGAKALKSQNRVRELWWF
ncbi:unnamed protein product [Penicillium olsonii]|nr:unnamed protein product [Penicillium olsonii]CAG7922471.1 unnamed protein product [Penicillium olsonii]